MTRHYHSKLHLPEAPFRPGEVPDYSYLDIPAPEDSFRPDPLCEPVATRELCFGLIRVLDDAGHAKGPWGEDVSAATLRTGLRHMLMTRCYDDRMFRMQRQGKLSFYMKCTGEEAIAVGQAMALRPGDMLFPSYRQQGLLFVRGRDVVDMMCHCISNSRDNCKGRQMPIMYSWKDGNYFTISGNLATQFSQAVGWAMGSAYKGEDHIAATWVGEGSSAEADVYQAMLFASTYKAPVLLNIVNNQWAISTPQSVVSGDTTFAARAIGMNIAGLRVDGNDFLAVHAVTRWAAERARGGGGATLIEFFTYRAEGHSTSDDPSVYRPKGESEVWPLGDPIERLKQHLTRCGEWSEEQHGTLLAELEERNTAAWKQAESYGSLEDGPHWPVSSMFEDVFKGLPPHLRKQRHRMMEGD
ncbi:MAG: 3-methyl-2-oxobutanoate dehydrogenase (2-methylpropanoyl-transferring) subunit alpha [Pseudomonadales bacterium]|jgi:2-oxoisovalerate dehydrogenase E1 component alpha subunit|nr:3-methyl-2-oxobutanoate dehydrogenase (2-methylpropanoyl-transferring) subunit alpha [Gammaproteobacteria bacterium]MBP6050859.1 3-methyl-2-oxobutanoate dehydrogenase (2-methylpropanoyl-transferring) subunit alpha [Pseudomonadales bacterium]MBK6584354.1 3-methyl-2-oxobutanoate dehydrogenase (2-methylpropanoyl-transferring) subunit alpha [Gammaproteobacteria bacterium]MBK7168405.1 3-methyl-2-oxobutanoate dehydrogenase (2-methylpropanoyl-transferring) subunit alpha [Gammaproteobacteria bacteriu